MSRTVIVNKKPFDKKVYLEFAEKFGEWGRARNMVKGSSAKLQYAKLIEEADELSSDIIDSLGDIFVVMSVISMQLGIPYEKWIFTNDTKFEEYYGIKLPTGEIAYIESNEYYYARVLSLVAKMALPLNKVKEKELIEAMNHVFNALLMYKQVNLQKNKASKSLNNEIRVYDLVVCLDHAWNEIKDRKGAMINGAFVKEADLPEGFKVEV